MHHYGDSDARGKVGQSIIDPATLEISYGLRLRSGGCSPEV